MRVVGVMTLAFTEPWGGIIGGLVLVLVVRVVAWWLSVPGR